MPKQPIMDLGQFDATLRSAKNLGTFSTTRMEDKAKAIFEYFAPINAVDTIAYPELTQMTQTCGQFLLELFHAPENQAFATLHTSGSSEAIFLVLLFLKHHWLSTQNLSNQALNVIVGPTSHVSFNVAAKALDIELRVLPFKKNKYELDEKLVQSVIDDKTIGFCCTLGSTITLFMDDVNSINQALVTYYQKTGYFIPIHVDAASGGFVAPFYYPDHLWDFRLSHVKSINVSSHKFGLVYPSLGWLCIADEFCIKELMHENSYLGRTFKRYPLQFSHSASHIAAQCYNIQTLGFDGYQRIIQQLFHNLDTLHEGMKAFKQFHFITPNHLPAVPGSIFTLNDDRDNQVLEKLTTYLRARNWHLPTFKSPHLVGDQKCARIVVKQGFTDTLINDFLSDVSDFFSKGHK